VEFWQSVGWPREETCFSLVHPTKGDFFKSRYSSFPFLDLVESIDHQTTNFISENATCHFRKTDLAYIVGPAATSYRVKRTAGADGAGYTDKLTAAWYCFSFTGTRLCPMVACPKNGFTGYMRPNV
jgi:hypothetical protein